mgnify:CR=1 FL=1
MPDDVVFGRSQRLVSDGLVFVHLHHHGADEVQRLHVTEDVGQGVGFRNPLDRLLAFGRVFYGHRFLEFRGGFRRLVLQILHDEHHGAFKGPDAVLLHPLEGRLEINARIREILDRIRRENLLQVVAHICRGFVVRSRTLARYLQCRGDFGHSLITGDAHAGKGRSHLRQELGHILQFDKPLLAARRQDIEGIPDLVFGYAEVVAQRERCCPQIVHTGAAGRGDARQLRAVPFELGAALDAARRQYLHPLQNVRLELIRLLGDVAHGQRELGLVVRTHIAGDRNIADRVLFLCGGIDGHARRGDQRGPLHGEFRHIRIHAATLFGERRAAFHGPVQRLLIAFQGDLLTPDGAHGVFGAGPGGRVQSVRFR